MEIKKLRYVLLCLICVNVLSSYADRSNLAIAILPITKEFNYTPFQVGKIFSTFYIGYTFNQTIGGYLSDRFGAKWILFLACFVWSVSEFLTIYCASNFRLFLLIRIFLGLGEGLAFPAIHSFIAKWFLKKEQSTAVACMMGSMYLGTALALLISPSLIAISWKNVFIVFSAIGFVWLLPWALLSSSYPTSSKWISNNERALISEYTTIDARPAVQRKRKRIPWKKIWTSKAVWAIIVAQYTNSYAFYVLLNYLPTYLEQYGYELDQIGYLTLIPYVLQFIFTLIATKLDRIDKPAAFKRQFFQQTAVLIPAFCLIMSRLVDGKIGLEFLFIGMGINSFNVFGVQVSHLDIAPNFSGLVFGIGNTAGNLPGVVGLAITGWILEFSTWNWVFIICVSHYLVGSLVWYKWSTTKICIE